jgi:16S rRNA (guanine527-N7)-methyltransferase
VKNEREQLTEGMLALGLAAEDQTVDGLLEYAKQLRKWNRSYNLVARGELPHLVERHLLDSLSIMNHLAPGRLLDVGTGAGLPGLVLAIADPQRQFVLLDSAGKKIRFLSHMVRTLKLNNVELHEGRVEDLADDRGFGNISSRAFSSIGAFGASVRHLAGAKTRLLAMKGKLPDEEISALPGWMEVSSVVQLQVPGLHGLHAERHLVIMSVAP